MTVYTYSFEYPPEGKPMTNEPKITQAVFAVGDNDWTATCHDGSLTIECGSLELSVGILDEDDWVPRAKSIVEALDAWNRKGGA